MSKYRNFGIIVVGRISKKEDIVMDYNLSAPLVIAILIILIWELSWKGFALWHSGRNGHSGWFIATLILNTLGILPIIYLLSHSKSTKYKKEYDNEQKTISV